VSLIRINLGKINASRSARSVPQWGRGWSIFHPS